jgi:hypothetical protein
VDCSISLNNCSGVVLDGFRLNDPKIREAAISIGKTCEAGTNGVLVRNLKTELASNVPPVRDTRRPPEVPSSPNRPKESQEGR